MGEGGASTPRGATGGSDASESEASPSEEGGEGLGGNLPTSNTGS